ncbi:MAG: ABC transporter substrate-binding protein [Desulfotomaculales bacterium]
MHKHRLFTLVLVLLFVAAMLRGCGGGQTQSAAETIKIGFLGAQTGSHASYGIGTLKGMQMAVEDINVAGGLLGKQVEIIVEDHGSKHSEAASVTQKLITQGAVAIIGDPTTGITKLAAPIAQGAGVVLLSAGAVGEGVVEFGDYIYRDTLLDRVSVPVVTKYLAEELGWKKVVVITSKNNDYSVSQTALFKKALADNGIEIVAEQSIQDGDQNFSAQVTAISQKEFDGIVFTGYYTEGGLFMKEVRSQGLKQVLVGGDGLLSPVLWEMGGEATEGSMVFTGFAADPERATGKTLEFIKKYQEKNGGKLPDMFSAQGYDAVMLIADAIKKAKSADPAKFKEALKETKDWQGVTGTITFGPDREPIKSPVYLLEVKNQQFAVKAVLDVK